MPSTECPVPGAEWSPVVVEVTFQGSAARVIRSARRRRTISLAVEDGCVVVRAPVRTTKREVEELLARKAAWIAGRLARAAAAPGPRAFADGERVPYLGGQLVVCRCRDGMTAPTVELDGDVLHVRCPESRVRAAAIAWYRARAGEVFRDVAARWAGVSGLTPRAVLERDQKRRWGSCGPDGTVRVNWRLVMAAPELIDYVVLHELAHLRHRNHGAEFWAEVARWMPDHRERRKRLLEVGPRLVL